MASTALEFLGGFTAVRGGAPLSGFESDKARGLLAYLALHAGRPQRRERLAGLFWPELSEQAARRNLRRVLTNLRDVLDDRDAQPPLLISTRQTIQFNPDADVTVDTVVLQATLAAAEEHSAGTAALEEALTCYRGDFLAGFSLPDSAPFEQWLLAQRTHYQRLAQQGLAQLVNRYEARGDWAAALSAARRQLVLDPAHEEAHRQVMRLLALQGDRHGALAHYDRCRAALAEELAVEPDDATVALVRQIRDGRLESTLPAPWGEALRGYELRDPIGSGAFGIVYRAYQPAIDRQVAIKVIRPEFANRPAFIRRFEAEAHLVARLDHLHIVPLYDYWREPDGAFLVMRWMRGGSMHDALQDGPWPPHRVAQMLEQIAAALAYAHQRDVIHGDVRPENILLDEAGNAYLSDFGIARDLMQPLPVPATDTVSGSIMAISPEQINGSPPSPLSDLYCLGLVLYQALLGRSPLAGKTPAQQMAVLSSHLPGLRDSRPDLTPVLEAVVQRATACDPADRYGDVIALALAFRAAVGEQPPLPIPVGEPVNPYKGLRPFGEADAADFFGRARLVRQLRARLTSQEQPATLLTLTGPSGSGKSSVVFAGLLPALRRDTLTNAGQWYMARMVPGAQPLAELELALRQIAVSWPQSLHEQLITADDSLAGIARAILPGPADRLLLAVDQFEELYTRGADRQAVDHFLRLLACAAQEDGSPLRVVLTLRADFYDRPLLHRQFSPVLRAGTEVILPLSPGELLDAVRRPAEQAGVHYAPGVAERIVAAVQDQPGALPILQYALTELFDQRQDRLITAASYAAIGQVTGALAQQAETLYAALDDRGQQLVRQLFLRLVAMDEGDDARPLTRRRVPVQELTATAVSAADRAAIEHVLTAFGDQRLLTFDRDPQTRIPTVAVAHEALLSEWPRLAGWLDENRHDVRLQRRLTAATAEWDAAGRPPGLLATGTRLAQYQALAANPLLALTPDESAFVSAAAAAAAAQQQREQRARRRMRNLGIAAGIAAVVAVVLALLAFNARGMAVREAQVNRSLVLGNTAVEAMEAGETDLALALALAAVDIPDPPPDAVTDLAAIAYGPGTRFILADHASGVRAATFNPDGTALLTAHCPALLDDGSCAAAELVRWDLAGGTAATRWPAHEAWITALAWLPDGDHALSGAADGALILWDMAAHTAVARHQSHHMPINQIALRPDGSLAAVAADDGTISLVDPATGAPRHILVGHEGPVHAVAFSPDGRLLASGGADTLIMLWDVARGDFVRTLAGHGSDVAGLAFSPDGATLFSNSNDLSLRLWDVANGEVLRQRQTGDGGGGLALSPDGRSGLHFSENRLYTWESANFEAPHQYLLGHTDNIHAVQFSPDGRLALSAADDGTVRIWNFGGAGDTQQTDLGFWATGVAAAPDGETLAVNPWGSDSVIWDLAADQPLRILHGGVGTHAPGALAISADGRYVAGASGDYDGNKRTGAVSVWQWDTGEHVCGSQGHESRPRTVAFAPDGITLFSGSDEADGGRPLIQWDVATCDIVRTLETGGSEDNIVGIAITADGQTLAAASNAGRLFIWDLPSGELINTFELPGDLLLDTVFGPGDQTVLVGAHSGVIVQWDWASGEEVRRLIGHDGGVWALAISQDGRWLSSVDDNGLVMLHDAVSGAELAHHRVHGGPVYDVAFSPDDRTIYSVSVDGTLVAWQPDDPSLAGLRHWIDENRYLRELTCTERAEYGVEPLCD